MAPQTAPRHSQAQGPSLTMHYACFFSCVPLGLIHRFIPTTIGRHLYSILSAAILLRILHSEAIAHFAAIIALSYSVMLFFRPWCGVIVTWMAFGHMTWCHWLYSGKYMATFPFSGYFMVLVLKLGSVAFNYQDGLLPEDQLTKTQALFRIKSLPSILEYLGYVCQGYMSVGPHVDYVDYIQYTERKGRWDPNEKTPNPLPAAGIALARTAVIGFLTFKGARMAPVGLLKSWKYHHSYSVWRRLRLQLLVFEKQRFMCYAMWSCLEAAWVLSGQGYSGVKDGKPSWAGAQNVRVLSTELAEHPAGIWANWNIHTGLWLRHYVYERLTPRGRKPGYIQLLATQMVSSIWHGPYLGQALFRVNASIIIMSGRVLNKYKTRLVERYPFLSLPARVLMWLYTQLTAGTNRMAFFVTVLTIQDIWRVFGSLYYLPLIVPLAIVLVGWLFPLEAPIETMSPARQVEEKSPSVRPQKSARETSRSSRRKDD